MDEIETDLAACKAVKHGFYARGEPISTWAHRHGFSRDLVYSVLAGRSKGLRGQAHAIAIALGLKPQPETDEETSAAPGKES